MESFTKRRYLMAAFVSGSLVLTGCSASESNAAENDLIGPASPSSSPAPTTYGVAVGTGEIIETEGGTTYETITIDPADDLYTLDDGYGLPEQLAAAGFTDQDAIDSQRTMVDYLVKDFIDSTALETGDAGYQDWYQNRAPELFTEEVYASEPMQNPNSFSAVLGNFGGEKMLPKLIHDGSPRVKNLELTLLSTEAPALNDGQVAIRYDVEFSADYRVDDTNAAVFAGSLTGMTAEQFLESSMAKDVLKDGTGENVYTGFGSFQLTLVKSSDNTWDIAGLGTEVSFGGIDITG